VGRGRLIADGAVAELLRDTRTATLEEAFVELTADAVEYRGTAG
jgi:hypothetical protein